MPSLEELVQEFARRARLQLMQQIEEQQDADTSTAKWQGYDADGNPIVKDGDQTKVVRGIGDTGLVRGQRVILDNAGSIEYKRRRQEEQKQLDKKRKRVAQPRRLKVRDNLISVAPVIEEEIYYLTEEAEEEFVITADGLYVLTYSTAVLDTSVDRLGVSVSNGETLEELTLFIPSENTSLPTGTNKIYRVLAGSVAAVAAYAGGISGTGSASVSGGSLGLSVSVSGTPSGEVGSADASIEVESSDLGGYGINLKATGSVLPIPPIELNGGEGAADASYITIPLSQHIYYYQIENDPEEETKTRIRSFDLHSVVDGDILNSQLCHNYARREVVEEVETVYVYSIWYVETVDMSQQVTLVDIDTGIRRDIQKRIGKVTRYIVHAKINMNTGEIENKVNESPNTGTWDFGELLEYDDSNSWLVVARAVGSCSFNIFLPGSQTAFTSIGRYNSVINEDFSRGPFNPEGVWKNAYPGDWLYPYRDIVWDEQASANISDDELSNFLQSSYKDEKFYRGWDTDLGTSFFEWDPAGSSREGNTPVDNNYLDIENLQSTIGGSASFDFSDYFDDHSSWRIWSQYTGAAEVDELGPNFATPEKVKEYGLPTGDRLRFPVWFSYVPPSTLP